MGSPTTSLIDDLLDFSRTKAAAFQDQIKLSVERPRIDLVAAASLFRVPRCLSAVKILVANNLSLEASTVARTLVELAISACWVGLNENRAAEIWNKFNATQLLGFWRVAEFYGDVKPIPADQRKLLREMACRPAVAKCARDATDFADCPAKRVAQYLYDVLYDGLSAASHGDLRHAVSIVQWDKEQDLAHAAMTAARTAAVSLLFIISMQLRFRDDFESFMKDKGLHLPWGEGP